MREPAERLMPSQNAPAPSPSSNRPPLSTSIDADALASSAGWRSGRFATSGNNRTRSVRAASNAISENVSRKRRWYGWSWIPTRSRPERSAARTCSSTASGSAASGTTNAPNSTVTARRGLDPRRPSGARGAGAERPVAVELHADRLQPLMAGRVEPALGAAAVEQLVLLFHERFDVLEICSSAIGHVPSEEIFHVPLTLTSFSVSFDGSSPTPMSGSRRWRCRRRSARCRSSAAAP